ncbi:MAG: hypothetical protein ABEJ87_04070 [Candidatus Nanohalobium sp.]
MDRSVPELIEAQAPQSKILQAAEKSPEYEKHEDDDRYEVFEGPEYLLIGVPGEGLYTEETGEKVDGVTLLDQGSESPEVCTNVDLNSNPSSDLFLEEEPWNKARETTYRIEGYWKEVMEEVLNRVPEGSMGTPIQEWKDIEETLKQTDNSEYELSGSTGPGEFQLYINNENAEAMIEFNHNYLRLHEKGETETHLEQVEGLQIDKVVTGNVDEDFKPHSTLNGVKN